MRIVLNGEPVDATAADLDTLLAAEGFDPALVATAVNGDFVPRAHRRDLRLSEGDSVEVFSPRQGG